MSKEHQRFLETLKHADEGVSASQDNRLQHIKNEKIRIENKPMSEITLAEQQWYGQQFGLLRNGF